MKSFKALLVGSAVLSSSVMASDYVMRISHNAPPAHHIAKAYAQFEKDVEAATNGAVDVQVFGSEQIFKATQNHAAVAKGQIEAASVISMLWGRTIPEIQVLTIPYMIDNVEKLKHFSGSKIATKLDDYIEAKGVKNIAWLVDASDGVFTSENRPLVNPEDFAGVKIRGLSKMFDNGLTAMGAKPSAMPGSEVYQALQTGVIDAGITSVSAAHARRFYEVQEFGVVTPLTAVYQTFIVNPKWWNSLPSDIQSAIQTAADQAEATLMPENIISIYGVETLLKDGMNVHIHTDEQVQAIKKIMQPAVIQAFVDSTEDGQMLVDMLSEL